MAHLHAPIFEKRGSPLNNWVRPCFTWYMKWGTYTCIWRLRYDVLRVDCEWLYGCVCSNLQWEILPFYTLSARLPANHMPTMLTHPVCLAWTDAPNMSCELSMPEVPWWHTHPPCATCQGYLSWAQHSYARQTGIVRLEQRSMGWSWVQRREEVRWAPRDYWRSTGSGSKWLKVWKKR